MRLSDITDVAADTVRSATTYVSDLATPSLRLGVTGLSRAGKTVFITAFVRTLVTGGASPPFAAVRRPGFRAYLEPQPDDDVPRFAYEEHLSALAGSPPQWPESTRQISQLRVTLEWDPSDWARQATGIGRRLHIDIVDYPGEWLIDLGLLDLSFEDWSKAAEADWRHAPRDAATEAWLRFHEALDRHTVDAEPVAIEGAKLFTQYLQSVRNSQRHGLTSAPGRFLMPGDLAGSPLLTFFPLPLDSSGKSPLSTLLKRRYESYKLRVIKPFFEDHFAKLDRQIVLVDVLSALNSGADALQSLDNALDGVLKAFRPGQQSWLPSVFGHRIDRILFAASKADHLNRHNHDRLRRILAALVHRAEERAEALGSNVETAAIAALRATEDVEKTQGDATWPCIRGIPVADETVGGRRFDGRTPAVVFPGDLPEDAHDAFDTEAMASQLVQFTRFQPPGLALGDLQAGGNQPVVSAASWPHIGLDRVVSFLIGDRLT